MPDPLQVEGLCCFKLRWSPFGFVFFDSFSWKKTFFAFSLISLRDCLILLWKGKCFFYYQYQLLSNKPSGPVFANPYKTKVNALCSHSSFAFSENVN